MSTEERQRVWGTWDARGGDHDCPFPDRETTEPGTAWACPGCRVEWKLLESSASGLIRNPERAPE